MSNNVFIFVGGATTGILTLIVSAAFFFYSKYQKRVAQGRVGDFVTIYITTGEIYSSHKDVAPQQVDLYRDDSRASFRAKDFSVAKEATKLLDAAKDLQKEIAEEVDKKHCKMCLSCMLFGARMSALQTMMQHVETRIKDEGDELLPDVISELKSISRALMDLSKEAVEKTVSRQEPQPISSDSVN